MPACGRGDCRREIGRARRQGNVGSARRTVREGAIAGADDCGLRGLSSPYNRTGVEALGERIASASCAGGGRVRKECGNYASRGIANASGVRAVLAVAR